MDGGSGFACATALPAAPDAGGVAGWPAAGGAGEGVPAVAAPGGFAGEGGVWVTVAPAAGSLAGLVCGAELQAARRTASRSRFIRSPFGDAQARGLRPQRLFISRLGMSVDPVDHGAIPELAVLWLQDPVALVREVEQARFDAPTLKRGEHAEPLLDGDAEVELALHDQRRRLEVLHIAAGREPAIKVRVLQGGSRTSHSGHRST